MFRWILISTFPSGRRYLDIAGLLNLTQLHETTDEYPITTLSGEFYEATLYDGSN